MDEYRESDVAGCITPESRENNGIHPPLKSGVGWDWIEIKTGVERTVMDSLEKVRSNKGTKLLPNRDNLLTSSLLFYDR